MKLTRFKFQHSSKPGRQPGLLAEGVASELFDFHATKSDLASGAYRITAMMLSSQSQKNQHRLIDASHVCGIEMTDAGS